MSELAGVLAAADQVQAFCRAQQWKFCFIGGIAVQRWGMPRFTQDVDLTLLAEFGDEARYVDALLKQFSPRLREARQFALNHRVVLARTGAGIDLDIALGALPFEEQTIGRATPWIVYSSISLLTCSAEDLIVHKAFAARDRDWSDIESVLTRQHGKLDLANVRKQLAPLLELKDDSQSMNKLEQLTRDVDERLRA
jgi:hypothetical protein